MERRLTGISPMRIAHLRMGRKQVALNQHEIAAPIVRIQAVILNPLSRLETTLRLLLPLLVHRRHPLSTTPGILHSKYWLKVTTLSFLQRQKRKPMYAHAKSLHEYAPYRDYGRGGSKLPPTSCTPAYRSFPGQYQYP